MFDKRLYGTPDIAGRQSGVSRGFEACNSTAMIANRRSSIGRLSNTISNDCSRMAFLEFSDNAGLVRLRADRSRYLPRFVPRVRNDSSRPAVSELRLDRILDFVNRNRVHIDGSVQLIDGNDRDRSQKGFLLRQQRCLRQEAQTDDCYCDRCGEI
jgi:hypothetical protein